MPSQDVTPTRSVLLETKKRIKLSQSGHKIMKMKRDGLIIEFFEVMEKAKKMRDSVVSDYEQAMDKIAIAMAVDGTIAVKSAAYALKTSPEVTLGSKSIMGMMVPKVDAKMIKTPVTQRGYGVIATSAYIEEAAQAFEKLLETIVRAAEIETTMKRLLDEIEKTKRRVNALEFKVIPELEAVQSFIRFRLEEMDRETLISLKHLKGLDKEAAE